jgi:RIO-like serine/threonine protein kinase
MRHIKLTGREISIVRAIGFTDSVPGAEIQEFTHMDPEDVTDTLNGLMSAGFVESVPYNEQIEMAAMPVTMFEVNPAYAHDIKAAFNRH